jgi:hypothetical protein
MALAREEVSDRLLYQRYIQAMKRLGAPQDERPSPGHVIRHCHTCGQRAMFRLDPEGTWYECLHCKHFD